jgi:Flp pilus assembly protein TadD
MKWFGLSIAILLVALLVAGLWKSGAKVTPARPERPQAASQPEGYVGAASCRECHTRFHELWATSYHGLAMQPFTAELARTKLVPQKDEIEIGKRRYVAVFEDGKGCVRERGPDGEKTYPIAHVMGGKNVYYFLTPTERGRLQTLPVAYDVRRKEWFNTAGSGVRHFPGLPDDEAVDWKDRAYTFNTSCFGCHVSQLSTNYDLKTDTYHTVWAEPGINCESCHGGAEEHIRVCREAPEGQVPKDLKLKVIMQDRGYTAHQVNTACAPCHAKMAPLTNTFQPGDRYFDHFDMVTLEHPDFYPDGRDLGENYTYTLWRMSPCVKSGKLDCTHCHTSSGRYRHKDNPNQSCLPCHRQRVENVAAHSRHPADSEGSKCIACHMPMTEFARMRRSDHSMLPPTPATTIALKSPNACSLCHKDQDAAWADKYVREWHKEDYQAPVLHRAGLIDAARKENWTRLPEILAYLNSKDRDEVFAASLIRLLAACDDERTWPAIADLLGKDPSPLVRASAASVLSGHLTRETLDALLTALRDEYRLVRVRAATTLAGVPPQMLEGRARKDLQRAVAEFEVAMKARPDDSPSHYNLGNFYMERREFERAIECFETAAHLDPTSIAPLVNVSLAHNTMGQNAKAEESLRKALDVDPCNAAAHFNLGLLLAELGRSGEAETAFRAALETDPKWAAAAYNLGVLLGKDRIDEAVRWCRKAAELHPQDPKYAYTLAFFQRKKGDRQGAIRTLGKMVDKQMPCADAYVLLGEILEQHQEIDQAIAVYRKAVENKNLSKPQRHGFATRIRTLSSRRARDGQKNQQ